MVYSSIPNKIWDRRLWSKEEKTFRGICQNPRGLFLYYAHPTSQFQYFSLFFSCITYVRTISNTLPLHGTCFLLLPYVMAKFILQVSTHMLPSTGSLPVQLGCPSSCSQHPVLFPIISRPSLSPFPSNTHTVF